MSTTSTPESLAPAVPKAAAWFDLAGGKHAVVLGGFSLAATLLLALAYGLTKAPIEQSAREDLRQSLEQVIPTSLYDNNPASDTLQLPLDGRSLLIYRARKAGQVTGVAFEASRKGYGGEIRLLLGVDAQGKLLGVRVLKHTETPGLGDKIEVGRSDWITRFTGLSLGNPPEAQWAVKKDGGPFDQFAGATITPRAVVNGIKDGLQLFAAHRQTLLEEVSK
ncbi:electron transport complex subunit RsxG [Rhodoferax sp.]|uniref:electron transport complex subunit RsxG n=1 Tax=Rhodoferax sp. TaxID=50421 RepID=UPI002604D9BC|nr:electron transport complex subunit RsxG [Rhodoferax sp.]MDD2809267.1 electron transport complex subunit RsxG [Rhodoferax sp.]